MKEKEKFSFTHKNLKKAEKYIKMYPKNRKSSAVMSLLHLVQKQCGGWIPEYGIRYVANMLNIQYIHVYEVANFYNMYNLKPIGKYLIYVCRTTPCWLKKSEEILNTLKKELKIDINETTKDGCFTLKEIECIGACINAPVAQINNILYKNLTSKKIKRIIMKLL